MKILFVFPFLLICRFLQAQVSKVEHFFVSSPDAEKLFVFFNHDFQLPVVWKFQKWGDFASGGLSLGNVVFEFVSFEGVKGSRFDGIALEPTQHMEQFIKQLDQLAIPHDSVQNNTHVNKDGVLIGWANVGLPSILPKEANLFVCDYKQREMVFF